MQNRKRLALYWGFVYYVSSSDLVISIYARKNSLTNSCHHKGVLTMKLYLSRFLACLMISISFLNIISLTSFADTRQSVKEVASKSDAKKFDLADTDSYFYSVQDYMEDSGISFLAGDELPSVNNTVSYQNILCAIEYQDMHGFNKSVTARPSSSDGYFSFPSMPNDFAIFRRFTFYYVSRYSSSAAVPSPGNYKMSARFSSNTGIDWLNLSLFHSYVNSNAETLNNNDLVDNFQQFSGDFYFDTTLKIASNGYSTFGFFVRMKNPSSFSFPFGGYINTNFTQIDSSSVDFNTSVVPPPSSEDIQSGIADSVGEISSGVNNINQSITSGVDSINGNLEEIIRTISMQLEAFWNQLYNGIHLPDMQNRNENTQKVVDSLDKNLSAIDNDILDGFDNLESTNNSNTNKITNNQNNNTSNIINNNNDNTDKLANGYDNQGMLDENKRLSDKLDEYENLENELLSDTKDNLNNFEFENPFLSFNAVMSDISYILTAIYNGLGSFNIPIAFSMTLTIAMLCIGWYRFKGGT